MDSRLKELIAERGQVKAALTRFKTFFDTVGIGTDIDSLQKRFKVAELLYDKFDSVQTKIEIIVVGSDNESTHNDQREVFESTYFDLMAKVERYIEKFRPSVTPSPAAVLSSPSVTDTQVTPRLPTIVLPTFDGNYNNWLKFRDTFESLIHCNESLSDIQRFHYLDSSLKGPAARMIQSLGVSDKNYKLAWLALKKRFEDPRALIYHHASALLELPSIQKPSSVALREFMDNANNHILALGALGEPISSWDTLIILILSKKLDSATCKEWENKYLNLADKPSFNDLVDFIEHQAKLIERTAPKSTGAVAKSSNKQIDNVKSKIRVDSLATHVSNAPSQCLFCKAEHSLQNCQKLKAMSHSDRHEAIKKLQCCFNCLQQGHSIKGCTRGKCRKCGKKHHTILHRDSVNTPTVEADKNPNPVESSVSSIQSCVSNDSSVSLNCTVLSTALVHVEDNQGRFHECRALLDVGSQAHFITESFCKKLGLDFTSIDAAVGGLGKASNPIHAKTEVAFKSRCNSFRAELSCLVIKDITVDMPNVPLARAALSIPDGITLADPHFARPGRVDLLIGAGLFWRLLCIGQHKIPSGNLVWQKTRLGWVLGGSLTCSTSNIAQTSSTCHLVSNDTLHQAISKFWEIENYSHNPTQSQGISDENICEQHFNDTTTRDDTGRFVVSIPFNSKIDELGDSRNQAEKRLANTERKLSKQPTLRIQYIEFMKEYESLGHMTQVHDLAFENERSYFLPHHAVFKESSSTTKLRVVFDGSAKTSTGLSLNDTQLVGPIVQSDLISILLRFRKYKFVLSADVEKMYRQVLVRPEDRRYQRILWRSDVNSPVSTYELNTVTYGTSSASFLATRALLEIGRQQSRCNPIASRVITDDFYVDDLLTGCETLIDAITLKADLIRILNEAGFPLRKWASNDHRILVDSTSSRQELEIKEADKEHKILGLLWSANTDELRYSVKSDLSQRISKRTILSEIAQIFDPLGLIGPVITMAKLMMQCLWQLKLGWDESLPQDIHTQWTMFRAELNNIASLAVSRRVMCNNPRRVELHGFADASEKAYGACIYLRSLNEDGAYFVRLLCSKSRVAPLKSVSLPRLELCAALLLSQLVTRVKHAFQMEFDDIYYWSDSTIVLAWLRGQSNRWKTFVANRVSEIQDLTSVNNWGHVLSSDNPADLISRGSSASTLIDKHLWWFGPEWLSQDSSQWPMSDNAVLENIPEERIARVAYVASMETCSERSDFFVKYSSYSKLIRIVAYCLRFRKLALSKCNNSKIKTTAIDKQPGKVSHLLTASELSDTQTVLLKLVQRESFSHEISALKLSKPLPVKSRLLDLNPFLDEVGLIRVGGRLANAPINYEHKHPVILPAKHPFTTLLVNYEHIRLLHAGVQHTLASLRARYWILSGKSVVKRILHGCVRCFRVRPSGISYIMGNLPAARVTPARPFATCGVDYAGPFLTKERGRSRIRHKSYVCIFVCFVTKAVHIELATDLSTDAFLNCLHRFISRRGKSQAIFSDNGTNFVGARNNLDDLKSFLTSKEHNERLQSDLSSQNIQWHFIPPHSPHFGGLWESAVKSAKFHLKRVIGDQCLTFEELYTVLTQIEACLNSRPLHPISSDPKDLTPLTPGHFLIGDALTSLPQIDLIEVQQNRLNRYQLIQQTLQHFWKRWHLEYLHGLQQRCKWRSNSAAVLKVNTLVVIREDNAPPLRWRLGRIAELHPGSDGVIRVVSVMVADGVIKRPVTKICVLPLAEDDAPQNSSERSN